MNKTHVSRRKNKQTKHTHKQTNKEMNTQRNRQNDRQTHVVVIKKINK